MRPALCLGHQGEVYRARDSRLNRDVALKVLPELFAADPERLARFTREAQARFGKTTQSVRNRGMGSFRRTRGQKSL